MKGSKEINTSDRTDAKNAVLLRSVEREHNHLPRTQRVVDGLGITAPAIQMDSASKYAMLAAGKGDILVRIPGPDRPEYREKIWDIAAGALIVEEAGGRITDIEGRALEFFGERSLERNRGILATNGHFHADLAEF